MALRRGLRKRCPHCGKGRLFVGWSQLERCSVCHLRFVRNPGDTWAYTVIGDRLPVAALIVLMYFGVGRLHRVVGLTMMVVLAALAVWTTPNRWGAGIALHYLARVWWPDPADPIPPPATGSTSVSHRRVAMKSVVTTLLAVVLGMALALVLVVGVELFSAVVYPIPADLRDNIPEHVRRYPHWILGVVVLAWGATSTAATWVASRVGNRVAGTVVALLLAWALTFNLTMLPYTLWFKIVMFGVFPIACLLGITSGGRRWPLLADRTQRSAET